MRSIDRCLMAFDGSRSADDTNSFHCIIHALTFRPNNSLYLGEKRRETVTEFLDKFLGRRSSRKSFNASRYAGEIKDARANF